MLKNYLLTLGDISKLILMNNIFQWKIINTVLGLPAPKYGQQIGYNVYFLFHGNFFDLPCLSCFLWCRNMSKYSQKVTGKAGCWSPTAYTIWLPESSMHHSWLHCIVLMKTKFAAVDRCAPVAFLSGSNPQTLIRRWYTFKSLWYVTKELLGSKSWNYVFFLHKISFSLFLKVTY